MTEIHACLCGNWVNLSADDDCVMGPNMASPYIWWEENAELYSPISKPEANSMYHQDYISLMKLHRLMNLKNIIGIVMNFHKYVNH